LLRENGDDVAIIIAHARPEPVAPEAVTIDPVWRDDLQSRGIELIELSDQPATAYRQPDVGPVRLAEQVAPILPAFDVVYFNDRANVAFHAVRVRRASTRALPVCVTVLHGPSQWVRWCDQTLPRIPDDLNLDFVERYSAQHSDFVATPSQHMLDWASRNGWQLRGESEVLGLPYHPNAARRSGPGAAEPLRRMAFFSPLQTRADFELLAGAVTQLFEEYPKVAHGLDELVLLGNPQEPGPRLRLRHRLERMGLRVTHPETFDRAGAIKYLAARASGTLAVIPPAAAAFPYAVIEASLIPGLNLICARGTGIPELLIGIQETQLFDASPPALAAKLRERLQTPLPPSQLFRYDYSAANQRWLAFHARVCERQRASRHGVAKADPSTRPTVDVCITYYNKARHFPQLLESLAAQTVQDFGLIAVDDGSPDYEARTVFDAAADLYSPRGWTFLRQSHISADAARNRAAKRSVAEYLLMLDADDVLGPNAVERMVEAARLSGDDCLVSASCLFAGDEFPFDPETGELSAGLFSYSMPLGANLVAALLDPAILGGPMILIRSEVFQAVGGYREVRGAARSDRELLARLALAGYKTDVLPEFLHFYRQVDDGLSRTCDPFLSKLRIVETYDRYLAAYGLPGVASALCALCDSRRPEAQPQDAGRGKRLLSQFRIFQPLKKPPRLSRFASDDEGFTPARILRRAYRQAVPLAVRLRLYAEWMKLTGQDEWQ
jgi:glycosyltransferase involved in cell wall biosynthesis